MLVTATGALILKILQYIKEKEHFILLSISLVLLGLAIFIMVEAGFEIRRILERRRALPGKAA